MRGAAAGLGTGVLIIGMACGRGEPGGSVADAPAGSPSTAPVAAAGEAEAGALVVDVRTTRVERGAIQSRISAPGSVVARRTARIGAEVRGRIEKVFVEEGDRVEAGDPLFQIDREPYEVALRQAQAGLDLARSERRQIEADLARADQLQKQAIVSVDQRDRVRTNVSVAKARETQASEAVALALHNLEQTLVEAPFGGSISARLVDEGTTALAQPQTIVLVLQETAELEAEAHIPEGQHAAVHLGDPAFVHVEGLAQPIETTVTSVGDTIDEANRTYHVRMRIPNPDHRLKAGVFARIEVLPRERRDVVLVPRESVRTEAGHTRVLVVRDGRAEAVPVRLGVVSETHAEVIDGLEPGTEVIRGASAREVAPGMRVRVVHDEASAP